MRQFAAEENRPARDVRTLILAHKIPTLRVGIAHGLDKAGADRLRKAFADLDREAASRGMLRETAGA
jgi:hypothetical protein